MAVKNSTGERKIKAVLFDFDGTLMNTNDVILESWHYAYNVAGVQPPADAAIASTFGEPLSQTIARAFPGRDTKEMLDVYRSYQREIFKGRVYMFPGVEGLVRDLKAAGYQLAIVTSRLWTSTIPTVYDFSIGDLFDALVSAEDTRAHKPDPTCLLLACEKLGIKPEEGIYIGDSRFDVHCAHNAGMECVLVDWTICMPPEMRSGICRPDYVIEKPKQLFDILSDLNKGE